MCDLKPQRVFHELASPTETECNLYSNESRSGEQETYLRISDFDFLKFWTIFEMWMITPTL